MAIQELALKYNPNDVNLLVPTQNIQQVSPWHAVRISEVRANPDPDAGDVFKVGSRYDADKKIFIDLFSPAKPLLMKVAAAAGIVWNWRESGPMSLQKDYVCWKAVGALRLPDGTWQPFVATKEIDLTVIEEELYTQNLKKAEEYASSQKDKEKLKGMTAEEWAQAQTKANMIQWRKNKAMRAETGAMLRVIRAALAMKSQYTKEELEKPFIVPRIDFNPDYNDPEVRHILLQNGAQAMANLFGSVTPVAQAQLTGQQAAFTHPAITAEFPKEETNIIPETEQIPPVEIPQPKEDNELPPWADVITCKGCNGSIEATGKWTPEQIAEYSKKEFGRELCPKCQNEARKAQKAGGTK